ncbi:MAG TPA: ion channel [Thermoanaerobaculia bacterium]|jgi:inward rectifier potassium channel|nr:ion channel [Thermoanaerobaculia bacterium]
MSVAETRAVPPRPRAAEADLDLGFGSIVARESRQRLLNRDGTFNVRREGLRFWQSLSAYHYLLTISWPKFFGYVVAAFLCTNAFFAFLYMLAGDGALNGTHANTIPGMFLEEFFFSVHTLATIGYGTIAPATLTANIIVTIETLVGLVSVAVMAGISFARFSRPVANILFSDNAVIAPYRGGRAFMFRIVNRRSNQLVDVEAKVMLSRRRGGSVNDREFIPLVLERERVSLFPLSWTVVHPIDAASPLRDWTGQDVAECDAEFLVMLNGFDETFSQNVHTRSSYKSDEIVWGARFASMFQPKDEKGTISVDIRKLHDIERVGV